MQPTEGRFNMYSRFGKTLEIVLLSGLGCDILYPIKLHAVMFSLENFIAYKDILQFTSVNEPTQKIAGNEQLLLIVVALVMDAGCCVDRVAMKSN